MNHQISTKNNTVLTVLPPLLCSTSSCVLLLVPESITFNQPPSSPRPACHPPCTSKLTPPPQYIQQSIFPHPPFTVASSTPVLVHPGPVLQVLEQFSPTPTMGFSFDRMATSFETIETDFTVNQLQLPSTKRFLEAMAEVNALFETLGSAFTFVKRDIDKKIAVVRQYATLDPLNYSDLNQAIRYEITNQCIDQPLFDGMPNCSRTILRLLWALRFTDSLLDGLGQTFNPDSDLTYTDRTLRWAVVRAYDSTLAPHHSWTIRRSVKGACLLLPTKESFLDRVGLEDSKRDHFISRLSVSMTPLVQRMYMFYERHDLLGLP